MLTLFLLDNSKSLKAKKWLKIRGCNVDAMLSNVIAMLSNVCYILSMIKKWRKPYEDQRFISRRNYRRFRL